MRTGELFGFRGAFTIQGVERDGCIEPRVVDQDRATEKMFGLNSIWIEPKFVELISRTRRRVDRRRADSRGGEDCFDGRAWICRAGPEVSRRGQDDKEKPGCNSKSMIRCIFWTSWRMRDGGMFFVLREVVWFAFRWRWKRRIRSILPFRRMRRRGA